MVTKHHEIHYFQAQWHREPHSALANYSSFGSRPPPGRGSGRATVDRPRGEPGPQGRGWQRMRGEPLTIILEAASGTRNSSVHRLGAAHPSPQCSAPEKSPEASGKTLARERKRTDHFRYSMVSYREGWLEESEVQGRSRNSH